MDAKAVTILIGEDDEIVALDMQTQLAKLGYQVLLRSGAPSEVVRLASSLYPDLIVLDLNIHGDHTGIHLAQEINKNSDIPIVFVSPFVADVLENDQTIPKPYRYVTKPFEIHQLQAAIQELVGDLGLGKRSQNTSALRQYPAV